MLLFSSVSANILSDFLLKFNKTRKCYLKNTIFMNIFLNEGILFFVSTSTVIPLPCLKYDGLWDPIIKVNLNKITIISMNSMVGDPKSCTLPLITMLCQMISLKFDSNG